MDLHLGDMNLLHVNLRHYRKQMDENILLSSNAARYSLMLFDERNEQLGILDNVQIC